MKRIKFTSTELYESEGRNKGPTYKEGSTHDFEDEFADRWLRRNVAVEVNTRAPIAEDPPKQETAALAEPAVEKPTEAPAAEGAAPAATSAPKPTHGNASSAKAR